MIKLALSLNLMLVAMPFAHAANSDDLCAIRPDLCDQTAVRKAATLSHTAKCRAPGAYSAAQADLPICAGKSQSLGQVRRSAKDDDLSDEPVGTVSAKRGPASVAKVAANTGPRSVSFEEYLAKNASHPALSGKIADHQRAFVDPVVTSTMSMPSDGVSTGEATSAVAPGGTMVVPTPAGNMVVPVPGGATVSAQSNDGFSASPGS